MEEEIKNDTHDTTQQKDNHDFLDVAEVRVLAVLVEKEALTPDAYPLSLNALTHGCNQLSSRNPVMSLSEEAVLQTLERLRQEKFVSEIHQAGARVAKYEHRLRIKWMLEQDKLAVLTILMLRGVQTAGEIRARSTRVHDFASLSEVETCLQFLIDKYPPLVARLPRTPGTKEVRYMHLLSGEVAQMPENTTQTGAVADMTGLSRHDRLAALEAEIALLKEDMAELKDQFCRFREQFE